MGMLVIGLVVLCVLLYLQYCMAEIFQRIATQKGDTEKNYFWWCFWLGLPGWLMVVALPDRRPVQDTQPAPANAAPAQESLPEL